MAPVAGLTSGSSADRVASTTMRRSISRSKTSKRIEQERILDHFLAAFLQAAEGASTPTSVLTAQKNRALQSIQKDSWSPADADAVTAAVHGLALKHSINLDHELSTALRRCYTQLCISCEVSVRLTDQARESHKRRGLDARNIPDSLIRPDNVSDAVQLLLLLSHPADVTARAAANLMLNTTEVRRARYLTPEQRKLVERREWLSILVDEPLHGDAWADNTADPSDSELSDWSLDTDDQHRARLDDGYDSDKGIKKHRTRLATVARSLQPTPLASAGFQEREEWTSQRNARTEALDNAVNGRIRRDGISMTAGLQRLTEADAVRESLAALMGCPGVMFRQTSKDKITLDRSVLQGQNAGLACSTAQLQAIGVLASTLASLRSFVQLAIAQSIQAVDALSHTPAIEAFAEQLQALLERLTDRLSELDADLCVACLPIRAAAVLADRHATLTQLLGFVHREAASVLLLARLLQGVGFISESDASAAVESSPVEHAFSDRALIDGLQAMLHFVHQQAEVALSDVILADLSSCLLAACRPAWSSVCKLIQRGLSFAITREQDTLFDDRLVQHMIKHDAALATSDSSFWTSGYVVRSADIGAAVDEGSDARYSPPAFLQSIMYDVLTTAKGVGLLRSLGIDALGEVQPSIDLDQVLGIHLSDSAAQINLDIADSESDVASNSDVDVTKSRVDQPSRRLQPREARSQLQHLLFPRTSQWPNNPPDGRRDGSGVLPQTPLSQLSQLDEQMQWESGPLSQSRRASDSLLEPALGRSLKQHLSPVSAIVRKRLIEVLCSPVAEGGYALQYHLKACHGLFLMQRGGEMSSWQDSFFADLDRRHGVIRATEHGCLNSGFQDVVETLQQRASQGAWIDTNLVCLSTGDGESESAAVIKQRTRLRRLADIEVDYDVPWPLTFVFPPSCMRFYQSTFTTLLQAKYAEWKLCSTLKLVKPETVHMRKFWSLRRQAQWLIRTLVEYLQRDVLLDGSERLCRDLEGMLSLDNAIEIHADAVARMEMLCFGRLEQAKVKELFDAAWRLGLEVANNYDQFIGASSREEDKQARKKRRERREKRRDKARRDGAPLGVITEADEEEEEEEEENQEQESEGEDSDDAAFGPAGIGGIGDLGRPDFALSHGADLASTSTDVDMSADMSSSWMESDTHKRERFRLECGRQRKALLRLVEELKISVDEQIGRIAAKAAVQAQDATQAERALREHDDSRDKWQSLLYALAWSDLAQ